MIDIVIIGNDTGLTQIIGKEGVRARTISDEIKALAAAKDLTPDIFFLFYDIRKEQTPEYISLLKQASQTSKVVLIGQAIPDEVVIECLVSGAQGHVNTIDELSTFYHRMIHALQAGEVWITRRITAKILERLRGVR